MDAGHLIDAEGVGVVVVVQVRGIEVAGADHLHLRLEHFGVFLLGVQPVAALMRLQLRLAQVATDLRRGDRGDDASEDGFVGEFGQGPVSNRSAGEFGVLASQRDYQGDLLGREGARGTRTRLVAEDLLDGAPQGEEAVHALDTDEFAESLLPAASPQADLMAFQADVAGNDFVGLADEGEQDDAGTHREEAGDGVGLGHFPEDLLLALADDHLGR